MSELQGKILANKDFDMDEIERLGIEGQAEILKAQLADGFPLVYLDKNGNMVQENPNGTITILKKAME